MKNKKLKLIALAGVAVTTAVMLTGCGKNDVKTYDKNQINVNISGMEETNNIQEENNVVEENKSIFKDKSSLKYSSNPKDDENGKIAIQKLGEDIFKTQVKDGYYVYVDLGRCSSYSYIHLQTIYNGLHYHLKLYPTHCTNELFVQLVPRNFLVH